MLVGSDGFEMVVMLLAEVDRDVMQCNAMMCAWGGERSVVGAWVVGRVDRIGACRWAATQGGPTPRLSPGQASLPSHCIPWSIDLSLIIA